MMLVPSAYEDIRKYYEGSYVKVAEFGDKFVYIHKVCKDAVFFNDSENNEGVIHLNEAAPYSLETILPHKTMFTLENKCYLLSRIPQRQYHRGLTQHNCQVSVLGASGWGPAAINYRVLAGYVNKPAYPPLDEAITLSAGSVALSARFAYHVTQKTIYCDTLVVGKVNPVLRTVSCNRLLAPEISRFISTSCKKALNIVVL